MKESEHTYFAAFTQITKAINSSLDLNEVLHLIVKSTCVTTGSKGCTLMLLDDQGRRLEVACSYGLSQDYLTKGPLFVDRSITDTLKGLPIIIEEAASDPRVQYPDQAAREGIASIISIPISARKKILGAVRLYTAVPCRFTDDDIEFLKAIATQSGLAIENARVHEHVKLAYPVPTP